MARLDLSFASGPVNMTDDGLVDFALFSGTAPTIWDWLTNSGNLVQAAGGGLTFDAEGRALSGSVHGISIDLGNNNYNSPDIVITEIDVAAPTLDNSPDSFWNILSGDDTIIGPTQASAGASGPSIIFGDARAAPSGNGSGGYDIIDVKDGETEVYGDVVQVINGTYSPLAASVYQGGNDAISGDVTSKAQTLVGDARSVFLSGRLLGGNDMLVSGSSDLVMIGDASRVSSEVGSMAQVYGGADTITVHALQSGQARAAGDVYFQHEHSFVQGGGDEMTGAASGDIFSGDVFFLVGGELIGGDDILNGGLGNDILSGDVHSFSSGRLTGGRDALYGGAGDDRLYGESALGAPAASSGGNDELFGGEGNDWLYGQSGADLLDGGVGVDQMHGGAGDDIYRVDVPGDFVSELAGEGADLIRTTLNEFALVANVENLAFRGKGNFNGIGNSLDNSIGGGDGGDTLRGLDGNDLLIGYLGSDILFGGNGNDRLDGGAGSDNLNGGLGNDSYHVQTSADVVNEAAGAGFDTIFAATSYTMAANAERLYLVGNGDYNANGRSGQNDFIAGNSGDNIINGFSGNDVIRGGLGNDTLTGGTGLDTFQFLTAPNTVTNHDTITDFNVADDVIQMDNAVYTLLGANGTLAAGLFKNLSLSAQDANDRILYDQANGNLYYDANGLAAGGVTLFADVTNGLALTFADFVVV